MHVEVQVLSSCALICCHEAQQRIQDDTRKVTRKS